MKDEKGITLTSLVITIIVLIILASIATYSGVGTIRYTNYNKAKAEMEMMQANVNTWYNEYRKIEVKEDEIPEGKTEEQVLAEKQQQFIGDYGEVANDPAACDQTKLNNTIHDIQENGYIATAGNFRFLSAQFLKNKLGNDFAYDYLVNIPERQVILFNGILYDGKKYYTAEDFGVLNISYNGLNSINFDVAQGDYEELFIYNLKFVDNQNNEFDVSKFRVLISEHEANSWKDVTNSITETTYNNGKAYHLENLEYKSYDVKVSTLDNKSNQKPITLIEPRAIFKIGTEVNAKMKQLAGIEGATYETEDINIKEIKRATEISDENKNDSNIVSTSEQEGSNTPIYMWFDNTNGTIYWYTKDKNPELNENSEEFYALLTKVEKIEVETLDTSNVTNMKNLFYNCNKLTKLDVSNFDTSNVKNMYQMFHNCGSLTKLDVSNFDTSNVTEMYYMFYGCSSLTELDVSGFDTSKVRRFSSMFRKCRNITTLDVSGFNTSSATSMNAMFLDCYNLANLNVAEFDTQNVNSMSGMFSNCNNLTTIDVSKFKTENVKGMDSMFANCYKLTRLDLSNFNTSNVENMNSMFSSCKAFTELDISGFNTSKVTNMSHMFYNCKELSSLELDNFDTSNVEDMSGMFRDLKKITSLDLSGFNTEKVKNMESMFRGTDKITDIDLSGFNTQKVENMNSVFYECSALTTIDISGFNTSKVTNMSNMFVRCSELTKIYGGNWDTTLVTDSDNMFSACTKLVGQSGTRYNYSYIDKTYAHIDGGTSNPGYFTAKPNI